MAQEVYTVKQSTLGSCIRTLRMQNNLTQLQLAELLGVTDKAVSKWEREIFLIRTSLYFQNLQTFLEQQWMGC